MFCIMSWHLKERAALQALRLAVEGLSPAVLASSFGAEDMVLLDLIARHALPIGVITIDTGRLPEETLTLMERVRLHYPGVVVRTYRPRHEALDAYVAANGPDAFYDSIELRRACCAVRKVEPLRRALAAKRAWVTGLRREQSVTRQGLQTREWDEENRRHKVNPLADWTGAEVWSYLKRHDVPVNTLHAKGYPSIGCAPCTRAVGPGEDPRAGRWWWENTETRECGLHPAQRRL